MGKNKGKKKKTKFIKESEISVDKFQLNQIGLEDSPSYPIFSFKYLQDVSINKTNNHKLFYDFLIRLKKLSELGWKEINKSGKHSFGKEIIPQNMIKHQLPSIITPEVNLYAFRAKGDNHPFVGYRENNIFHILYIEANFGDIYDHD